VDSVSSPFFSPPLRLLLDPNSRSFVGVKHSITTGAGVIDADYRGKVGVLLFNLGDKDFESESANLQRRSPEPALNAVCPYSQRRRSYRATDPREDRYS